MVGHTTYDKRQKHNFRELKVGKEPMDLARTVLVLTKKFPDSKRFGRVSQLNRAAVSVPSDIAEGSSRKSNKVFANFPEVALGAAYELETQLLLASDLGYAAAEDFAERLEHLDKIQRMLSNLVDPLDMHAGLNVVCGKS